VYTESGIIGDCDILIHTSRNTDWQPPLRRWRTNSAAVTANSLFVSGGHNTLVSPMTFQFPASRITEGTYALMALMDVTTAGTLTYTASIVDAAGSATVGTSQDIFGSIALPVTSGYKVLKLASLQLPPVLVEGDQLIELVLTGTANMDFDEGWLFGLDDGALTWIDDADASFPLQAVQVRSPELGAARPSVYGRAASMTSMVCIDYKCESFGAHQFDPGLMQVTTVNGSIEHQSEIEHYRRYHSHVLDESA
jgi:hypothetical protein